jgi:hypothetical protein
MPGRTINGLAAESSRKRARRAEQDDDVEVVEVQQARSSLRTEPVSSPSPREEVPFSLFHNMLTRRRNSGKECEFLMSTT